MSAISPCPFCGAKCSIGVMEVVFCQDFKNCGYRAPEPKEMSLRCPTVSVKRHNALCARLEAAKAMAEALEPLAREADNWLPGTPDYKWIGHSNVIGSVLSEYIPINVGHARAAQRALAAWKAAHQKEPS